MNDLRETDIIRLCKQRNPKGQKALVYQYGKVLMGLAYRYTLSKENSKDILQDIFIHVFQKIDLYDPAKGAFLPWLKSVAVRMILMYLRKEKTLVENQQLYVEGQRRDAKYQLTDANLLVNDLYKMVLKLSDVERLVFNMYAIEGFSHKEIAKHIDISESYSRTILTRARKSLQKLLAEVNVHKTSIHGK